MAGIATACASRGRKARGRGSAGLVWPLLLVALLRAEDVIAGDGVQRIREEWRMSQAEMGRPPDEEAVIAQEFRGAVEDGSSAALIRFIARHPEHALAGEAWRRLEGRTAPDERPLAHDPDAAIYAAFDAARRVGAAEAYRAFARTYPNHPLAAEADRRIRALQ
ncbi:hypothetical protein [Inquilinus limosus]|uniref:hypothetical protein n=1 Tax=Inquilinus limosus TaxID=171674 RepID=UPI0012DC99EA|nr:hypothetical protein [Inquilinus limosus]